MKMVHGLRLLLLTLSLILSPLALAKTLQVDIVTPSVTNGDFTITPNGSGNILFGTFSGVLKASSGVLSASNVNLTSEVVGVLPVANGGTNSSTALNNSFVMISNSGAIVEDSAVTTTELSYLDGVTSSIQTQLDSKSESTTVTKTTTATLATSGENNVVVDATSGDFTVTLPAATSGLSYKISKSTAANIVTIDGNSTETIDLALTTTLERQGQSITIFSDGSNWFTSSGRHQLDSMVRLHTGNGHGSTNTKIRRFTTTVDDLGSAITYADSATLGASFTIEENGIYFITYTDASASADDFGLSLNTAFPTTSIGGIPEGERLASSTSGGTNYEANVSWSGILSKGDVIRPHSTGSGNATTALNFTITKIGRL